MCDTNLKMTMTVEVQLETHKKFIRQRYISFRDTQVWVYEESDERFRSIFAEN